MCIAILNTKEILDFSLFEQCWSYNPDGGGIAYIRENEIKVIKEMDCVYEFYGKYLNARKESAFPMIIHFRFATSGMVDEENCHPFEVSPGLVMVHNGILDNVRPTKKYSDTHVFNGSILSLLPRDFIYNEGIKQLMAGFIEDSKLIFLDRFGMYSIINEQLGHWDEKHLNWYSNYSYLKYEDLGFESRHQSAHPDEYSNLAYCESCGNYAAMEHFDYLKELNETVCKDCFRWYKGQSKYF